MAFCFAPQGLPAYPYFQTPFQNGSRPIQLTGGPWSASYHGQLPWMANQGGPYGGGYGGSLLRDQMLVYGGYRFPRKSECFRPDEFGLPPPDRCQKSQSYNWNEQDNTVGPHKGCTSSCQCSGTRVCDMRFGTWGYCTGAPSTGLAS